MKSKDELMNEMTNWNNANFPQNREIVNNQVVIAEILLDIRELLHNIFMTR